MPRADGTCPICHGQVSGATAQRPAPVAERSVSPPPAAPATEPSPANPYASPTADVSPLLTAPPETMEDLEHIRREYLSHEASVRSIGTFYYLSALMAILLAIPFVLHLFRGFSDAAVPAVMLFGIAGASIAIGRGLRRLRPWASTPAGILAGLSLLAIPLGTVVGAYFLYLLFSRKGAMIFSPTYQEILRRTPHIRYRTSALAMGCLIVLVVALLLAILVTLLPAL